MRLPALPQPHLPFSLLPSPHRRRRSCRCCSRRRQHIRPSRCRRPQLVISSFARPAGPLVLSRHPSHPPTQPVPKDSNLNESYNGRPHSPFLALADSTPAHPTDGHTVPPSSLRQIAFSQVFFFGPSAPITHSHEHSRSSQLCLCAHPRPARVRRLRPTARPRRMRVLLWARQAVRRPYIL